MVSHPDSAYRILTPFELVAGGDQGVGHGLGGQGEDEVVNGVSIALLDDLHGRDVRVDRPHRRGHLAEGAGDVRDLDTKNEHDPIVRWFVISEPGCGDRTVTTGPGNTRVRPGSMTYLIRSDGGLFGTCTHSAATGLCLTRSWYCQVSAGKLRGNNLPCV